MLTSSLDAREHAPRPLRRDAERNRRRILDAAEELFAERGLAVTLNDIAHHAGVGVGTVYRRFPDKGQLIDALFERRLEELVELMEQAVANPDPWAGLTSFLERSLDSQACNTGLKEIVMCMPEGVERVGRIRARLLPLGVKLIRRAQESGQLRSDIDAADRAIIQLMLGAVIDGARAVDSGLWRRYLELLLQGLRADGGPPAPLRHPPIDAESVDQVMAAAKLVRR
jgi:AcrR family transcriptional regulator